MPSCDSVKKELNDGTKLHNFVNYEFENDGQKLTCQKEIPFV